MVSSSTIDRASRPVLPVLLLSLLLAVGAAFAPALRVAGAWPLPPDGVTSVLPAAVLPAAVLPSSVTDVPDRDSHAPARVRPGHRAGATEASMPGGALVPPAAALLLALLVLGLSVAAHVHRGSRDGTTTRGRGPPRQRFDLVS